MEFKSQVGQDKWVCDFFKYKRNGFFLDIGAYDGEHFSNTWYLEKELEWDGVCVEAGKIAYSFLARNRSSININAAIDIKDGTVRFLEVGEIGRIGKDAPQIIEGMSMKTLLEITNAPKIIDYISLDIEGSEYNALLGFPFGEYEVILWTIEHNSYLDGGTLRADIRDIMHSNGYVIAKEDIECGGLAFEDWYVNKTEYNEKKIFEILKKNELGCDDGYGGLNIGVYDDAYVDVAKEITSHVMEFIEWIRVQCEADQGVFWYVYGTANEVKPLKTSEELYQYWLNKVKNGLDTRTKIS